ncbi:uncharacterized protein METZ01_LOCUS316738, partial [marine metagenome]
VEHVYSKDNFTAAAAAQGPSGKLATANAANKYK